MADCKGWPWTCIIVDKWIVLLSLHNAKTAVELKDNVWRQTTIPNEFLQENY